MINVAVDRETWYRGEGMGESKLLRKDGRKCCVGFLSIELGACANKILGRDILNDVKGEAIEKFTDGYAVDLTQAYVANDDTNITEAEREAKLIIIGQHMNVNFSFIN